MQAFRPTTYIHKGMSPLSRHLRIDKIALAFREIDSDILLLREGEGENLRRSFKFNTHPRQAQYGYFGEYFALNKKRKASQPTSWQCGIESFPAGSEA